MAGTRIKPIACPSTRCGAGAHDGGDLSSVARPHYGDRWAGEPPRPVDGVGRDDIRIGQHMRVTHDSTKLLQEFSAHVAILPHPIRVLLEELGEAAVREWSATGLAGGAVLQR